MTLQNMKSIIKKNWIFYLLGFTVLIGLKYYYSKAGSDELRWILAPIAWWVRILGGVPFAYEPQSGYVNHSLRFIIAPSCSGVSFMIIVFATLLYSFVHRMRTIRKGFCWTALSMAVSYFFTILVNGLRIVVSIYLPLWLQRLHIGYRWLTPERLHTTIGIVIYFTSLCVLYRIAGPVSLKIADLAKENAHGTVPEHSCQSFRQAIRPCLPPMFWYFAITLGIPLLRRAYRNDFRSFAEYVGLMTGICTVVIGFFAIKYFIQNKRPKTD